MIDVAAFHLRDTAETEQFGEVLGDLLRSTTAHPGALILLLSGDLGAGKTTMVRGLASGLGADPGAIASPTFTIRMDHRGEARALVHIDAWRISADDLEQIGFDELCTGDAVIAIEWPERITTSIPARHIRIALDHAAPISDDCEAGRVATISFGGGQAAEHRRIIEGLSLLVRAPRIASLHCPVCGRAVESGGAPSPSSPFCSPRCRLADLGDWLLMRHRIPGTEAPEFDE